ncbi:MAG: hypothetical protein NTW19_14490 [Planctomycetota bacterium]|nr:hypothetical protein [Planctomycetota bacterium]
MHPPSIHRPARAPRPRGPRTPLLLAALALLPFCSGCTIFNIFGQVFPPKAPAIYELPKASTVVLVEDPNNAFPDPALPGVIASRIIYDLKTEGDYKEMVSPEKLHDYMVSKGEAFAKIPLDQIAKDLEAKQIISVVVEYASLNAEPGVYRPAMAVRVKVIDADKSKRLFPALGEAKLVDPSIETRGYPVTDTMFYQISSETGRSEASVVMRRQADRLGRNVGWLFYEHKTRQPGDRFEE